ncbi:MAG TPA: butyrate kinase [Candidatus Marinimicrobia bacterium]|nr:butyrate kinase [Candidatus Neomarinimicrobiota bacterium]HRS50821.1 butyrate kinase [Candidatus Neomarinimicrobiota bacterium]HRU91838.1 butyrate kinase [Candidatus Neomarinimicrobiota bacterium]
MKETVLVVNPGSTSTKIALFDRQGQLQFENISHVGTPISRIHSIAEQLPLRIEIVTKTMKPWLFDCSLKAVVGRGGLLKPLRVGVYKITPGMIADAVSCKYGEHASNLGAPIAEKIANRYHVPSFVVDPVTVDEMIPEARISGVPEIERASRQHTLNIRACVRKASAQLGRAPAELNFVVAHLGGGVSITAVRGGRLIDCNDALLGMGPFSPERAGALPLEGILNLAYSGKYTKDEMKVKLTRQSGLVAYLGTNDAREVWRRAEAGDQPAALVFKAMIYQICKEIGAMATVLNGNVDGIIITGGQARGAETVEMIRAKVGFIAPLIVFPSENEMEALAEGGWRALDGLEEILVYEEVNVRE